MTSIDSTPHPVAPLGELHPYADGLYQNFGWLIHNVGNDLWLAAVYGMWQGMIDPGQAPEHEPRSREGRAVLRDWLNEHGVIAAYEADQVRQAVPLQCPAWCTVVHDESLVRPDAEVEHQVSIVDQDGVSVDLLQLQTAEGADDRPYIGAGAPGQDYAVFHNPEDLRRYAEALVRGAARLAEFTGAQR